MVSRIMTAAAVAALLVAGFVGFGFMNRDASAQSDAMGEGLVVLHRGNGAEPSSLDPHKAAGTWENNIIGDLFLGLYTEAPDGSPILGAAEAHEISEDGLTHTFTIREGLVWSDGEPVTAFDFEFSLKRIINPETAARYASLLYPIENAADINGGINPNLDELGVRAVDARTFEITLNRPAAFLPWLLTHYTTFALPQHVIERYGDAWTRPENMVTNGAYTLAEWTPNDHITTVANPLFYDAANVAIDQVIFYPTDDESAALRRFRAGELDMNTGFPSQQYEWLQKNMPEEMHVADYIGTSYLSINTERPPFDDVRIRQALALAIDRDIIAYQILKTGETPAYTLVPPLIPNYTPPQAFFADWDRNRRITEAKRLMREVGYSPENRLRFEYRYRESVDNRRIAVAIGRFWRKIYVDVDLINTEPAVHYRDLEVGNYSVGDAGWIADYPDAENYLFLLDSSSGLLNYGNYANAEYDALLALAQETVDATDRATILAQAEAIIMDEMPLIPIIYLVSRSLVGQQVVGYVDNPVHIHRTRWMSIDESRRPTQDGFVEQIMRWFD